jgi:hypothetical protein
MELQDTLVNLAPFLFVCFVVFLFAFIAFMLYSKKGKESNAVMLFGGEVVENLGQFADNKLIFGGHQTVDLLRCRKDSEDYYVLAVRDSGVASVNVFSVKMSQSDIAKFVKLTSQAQK